MPKKKRQEPLYRRGKFWLDWDRKRDGSLRSPFLQVFWYDERRGGNRSASARTADEEEAKAELDRIYLEQTGDRDPRRKGDYLLISAINAYQTLHADGLESAKAIEARLDHVVAYLKARRLAQATCEEIDEEWIARFRAWAARQPIISPKGLRLRDRSPATIEASVAQLSAAINDAHRRRNARHPAAFRAKALRGLNRSPLHRSDIPELAAMFRYCVAPDVSADLALEHWGRRKESYSEAELIEIRRRERSALHRFLIISLASLARPDAAHDVNIDPRRRQWISNARILALNPAGRQQTKKYRATVPIARQVAPWLDAALAEWLARCAAAKRERRPAPAPRFFVGPRSIRRAWEGMALQLGLPGEREAGMKLIRRSMAKILRDRLPKSDWPEISMMMGHAEFDQTTDIYAPFSPDYLGAARAEIERIIDEIESLCPGAFSRTIAGAGAEIIFFAGRTRR